MRRDQYAINKDKINAQKRAAYAAGKEQKISPANMSRKQLEEQAVKIYVRQNAHLGAEEAERRARALMDGNTDAQLRKYIKKDASIRQKLTSEENASKIGRTKNISLSRGSRNDILLPDTIIRKSLGAKAKNYEVFDPSTGEKFSFVEGTKIQDASVFAGFGTRHPLDDAVAQGLAKQIGGDADKWQHCKGNGHIDVYGEDIPAEVYWFQEETVCKHKFKVKRWLDES